MTKQEVFFKKIQEISKKYKVAVEPNSDEILKKIFNQNQKLVIFDVGGFDGCSVLQFKKIFPNSTIYSFEPFLFNYLKLKKLESKQVKTFNLGLSSKNGKEVFYVNKLRGTNSILPFCEDVTKKWGGLEGLKTEATIHSDFITLDYITKEKNINKVDLLKLDVQGAEFRVLEGAKNTLNEKKISTIKIELIIQDKYLGQKSLDYYFNLFNSFGYKPLSLCDIYFSNSDLLCMDAFFILE